MGRGRAKAKQTKVARRLKYSTTGTDLERLQRELAGGADEAVADDDDLEDDYDEYSYGEDDDEDESSAR